MVEKDNSRGKRADPQDTKEIENVLPERSRRQTESEIGLLEIWSILWIGRKQVIAVVLLFTVTSAIYALAATEWYRSESLLAPMNDNSAVELGGQLGGLAALAGATVDDSDNAEAIAVLESRDFAREFIEESNLLPLLFAQDWDSKRSSWEDDDPRSRPDIRDAVRYFHENILHVRQERQTGLVMLAIEWTDPELAAKWSEDLIIRINTSLRDQALREAEANVAYLQAELAKSSVVTLQQSIGSLLEGELKKLMLARGNAEFAFRVVDKPNIPKYRVRPRRIFVILLGVLLGGTIGVFGVLVTHAMRSNRPLIA